VRSEATREFVRQHAGDDVRRLALQGTKNPEVELSWALDQIAGRQKARTKLPSWAETEDIEYPPHLSMEQCSSESTARYKTSLIPSERGRNEGASFVDLTGGFGVDFSFLSRGFDEAVYVERQEQLCDIAARNFQLLGVKAEVVCGDGVDYLERTDRRFDLIYLDPARRDDHGGRTYAISDCTPDVLSLLPLLIQKGRRTLVKLSPMLDWRKAVSDVGEEWVREVHIVSVDNECKELLLLLGKGEGLQLVCVNLPQSLQGEEEFRISLNPPEGERNYPHPLSPPEGGRMEGWYLYEPNSSLMKAGCFDELALHYGVAPIAANSHLFVSDQLTADFPGRRFVIDDVATMNKRELKEKFRNVKQANIAVRNFPMSVAELRKRLKLADGGNTFLFATTLADGTHRLLICRKIG
jgi:hypothetical protein